MSCFLWECGDKTRWPTSTIDICFLGIPNEATFCARLSVNVSRSSEMRARSNGKVKTHRIIDNVKPATEKSLHFTAEKVDLLEKQHSVTRPS